MTINIPSQKPFCPNFGSGPTCKYPGWDLDHLNKALLSRSHRSIQGKEKLRQVIDLTHKLLNLPSDYKVAIIAGSTTGAFECALWSLLGERPVDVMNFDVFGKMWLYDITEQLKISQINDLSADYGELPNCDSYNSDNDLVFTWNGTTSGACFKNGDWIPNNRQGLTICDATSAVFCVDLPWEKLDVTAFAWQKGLGSEAAHGMLILSPRALERLGNYNPSWPIPRIFRLKKEGKINEGIFRGETINTPSMLCVEDYLNALQWALDNGGMSYLTQRCQENFSVIKEWVNKTSWVEFMAKDLEITSPTSVCLELTDLKRLDEAQHRDFLFTMATLLRQQNVALDIINHNVAPPSLRVWCGPTIEKHNLELLTPWLEWAYHTVYKELSV